MVSSKRTSSVATTVHSQNDVEMAPLKKRSELTELSGLSDKPVKLSSAGTGESKLGDGRFLNRESLLAANLVQMEGETFKKVISGEMQPQVLQKPKNVIAKNIPVCEMVFGHTNRGIFGQKTTGLYPRWTFEESTNGRVDIKLKYSNDFVDDGTGNIPIKVNGFDDPLCNPSQEAFILTPDVALQASLGWGEETSVQLAAQEFKNFAQKFTPSGTRTIEEQLEGKVAVMAYGCSNDRPEASQLPFFVFGASDFAYGPVFPKPSFDIPSDCKNPVPTATYTINSQPTLGFYNSEGNLAGPVPSATSSSSAVVTMASRPTISPLKSLPTMTSKNFEAAKSQMVAWNAAEMAIMGLSLVVGLSVLFGKRVTKSFKQDAV